MFSKKTLLIVGAIVLIIVNITILYISSSHYRSSGFGRVAIFFVAPLQEAVTDSVNFTKGIWNHYFYLVSVAQENDNLKKKLSRAVAKNSQYNELELSNQRLRNLLNFKETTASKILAAEVISVDPSSWFKAVIIDKGSLDGVERGLPVVIRQGIAGQVVDVSSRYSKIMLIIDRNSSVDALVQRTRARGIIKGEAMAGQCLFKYVLRKDDVRVGDTIVASGLDGVFPKGLPIGDVKEVVRRNSGVFQEVRVVPYVDFEKLEEVLVLLNPSKYKFVSK
ncbi:MAG: rod shape-determining protein MreC [Desulfobacteraceae bacterium 4572_123]|nr:MAG: rod shape-determining protein MreC [Desulfobacteraceae bacterium 4572_123]